MSLLKKHSIKKWLNTQFVQHHYSRPSFIALQQFFISPLPNSSTTSTCQKRFLTIIDHNKLFGGLYPAIMRGKIPKISIMGHFLSRASLKKFSDKIFVGNNVTYLLEKFLLSYRFSKNMYNRKIIALSKASNSSFLNCLYFPIPIQIF